MHISDLEVDGFGVWKGLQLNDISDKLTVVYGPNEAGKTTLMQFVRGEFYGFDDQRHARYLAPVYGGRPGGTLRVTSKGTPFCIQRRWREVDNGEPCEQLVVTDDSGHVHNDRSLSVLLSDIDETTFSNVFAIGLRELQELATLTDTEAAQHLYAIAGGLDRVSLVEVRRELNASRERLFEGQGPNSHVGRLLARRRNITGLINNLTDQTRRWARQSPERDELTEQVEDTEVELQRLKDEARKYELALSLWDCWSQRDTLKKSLAKFSSMPRLAFGAVDELDEITERVKKYTQRQRKLKRKWEKLRKNSPEFRVNLEIWRRRARIEALKDQQAWVNTVQDQATRLQLEIDHLTTQLGGIFDAVGVESDGSAEPQSELLPHTLSALQAPAQELRKWKKRLASAKRTMNVGRQLQSQSAGQLEQALATRSESDLMSAVDSTGRRVELLRRRVHVDERQQQMNRHRRHLEEESRDWLERRVLTGQQIWFVGGLFVLGTILMMAALFGWSSAFDLTAATCWCLGIMGLTSTVAAAVLKTNMERTAQIRLDECQEQIRLLESQLQQLTEERDQLEEALPQGGGPFVVQLKAAEEELNSLQQLLPIDAQRKSADDRFDVDGRRVRLAAKHFKKARSQWRNALVSLGLSDTLSPDDVDRCFNGFQHTDLLRRRLNEKQNKLEQRRMELSSVDGQVRRLLVDADLEISDVELSDQIDWLLAALREQEQRIGRRKSMRQKERRIKNRHQKYVRALVRLRRRRRKLFAQAGVADRQQFRRVAMESAQMDELRQQRSQLDEQIAATLVSQASEEDVAGLLDDTDNHGLERKLERLTDRQQACEKRLNQLYEQRAQQHIHAEQARDDRRLAEAQLELGCVEQQLRESIDQWRTIAVTSQILTAVCTSYEAEHQPETLREASKILKQFTDGKYQRIWTSLDEDVLRIDDDQGQTLDIESLSSGTREQIFLSLRLALAALFARRGSELPMLLDDVLVNFDAARTKAAGRVLRDFSKSGHQLILFTCHEHIMKIFRSMRVQVITLPDHKKLASGKAEEEPPRRRKKRVDSKPTEIVRVGQPIEVESDAVPEEEAESKPLPELVEEETVEAEVETTMTPSVPVEPLSIHDSNVWDDDATWYGESLNPSQFTDDIAHWEKSARRSNGLSQTASTTDCHGLHPAHSSLQGHLRGQQRASDSTDDLPGGEHRQVL